MLRFTKFHSIVVQLFLFCFIGMTLPVLVMGFLSYNKSSKIVEEQVGKVASLTITQVSDKLNLLFKKLDDSSMMVLSNRVIHEILEKPSGSLYEKTKEVQEGREMLTSIMINSPEILDIYIFDVNRKYSVFSADSLMAVLNQWDSAWYKAILEANGNTVWFGLSASSYVKNTDTGFPIFALGRAIRSWESGKVIGVMVFEILGDSLIAELDRVQFGDTGYVYIVDDDNRYFYHPDPQQYGRRSTNSSPDDEPQMHRENNTTLMIPSRLDNGWHVVGLVPLEELTADSASIRNFTIWIALCCIAAALGMGYFVTRKIGNPLVQLCRLMRKGEAGDLSVRSMNIGRNEIGQLGRSFNKMLGKIDQLIHRIAEEEKEKKKAEVRALRYQINPHFMYNTLNSIRWMAKLNRTSDVDLAVTALVQLLEGSLGRNGVFMKLSDELQLLRKYMLIQEYRYDNPIVLEIQCPESLMGVLIPRMLLQPIVENAIFHGIAPKDAEGKITLTVEQQGADLVIRIKDDGIGIEPERVSELLASEQDCGKRGMTNIGVRHVHQMVQLYYGAAYGLRVKSEPGVGTEVSITLSLAKGEQYVQSTAG
ncbi:sensor histidine kinase [Paenibacillus sp. GCM10027626]|uniref:sensor histidine kinase n=1 Tax=Paenibacillus sp. GCM10027626 TaxID=3273411 RepID=UPI0036401679